MNWASLTSSPAVAAALTDEAFRTLRGAPRLAVGSGVGLPVGDGPADGAGLAVGLAEGAGLGLPLGEGVGLGDGHRMGTGMTQPGLVAAAGWAAAAARPGSIRAARASGMTARASLRFTVSTSPRGLPPTRLLPPAPLARPAPALLSPPGRLSSTRPRPSDGDPGRRGRGRCWPASRPGPGVHPKLSEAPVTPSSMPTKNPPRLVATKDATASRTPAIA